jgi:GrpB-like predicted nucleotidyltransferase (UPF0157 family)
VWLGDSERALVGAPGAQIDENRRVESKPPIVVPYKREWPTLAFRTLLSLREPFSGFANRFEHIGSTAIPGMAAKDVLDLQVSVLDLEVAANSASSLLNDLGFRRSPYMSDHIPAGRMDDPKNWSKRFWTRRIAGAADVNLHVRRTGSPNERLALLFRDWFRNHPDAVPAYASFKLALAQICPDIDVYSDTKDPVVDLVIAVAEEWAPSVGWTV